MELSINLDLHMNVMVLGAYDDVDKGLHIHV